MAKAKKVVSPAGIAVYPRLNEPDTKFDPDGTYHVKLRADSDEPAIAKHIEQIDAWHEESRAKQYEELLAADNKYKTPAAVKKVCKDGDKPYTYETDEDGEDTNIVLFSYKMKSQVTARKDGKVYTFKPVYIDAHKKVLKGDAIPQIWGGSELKIRFEPILWNSVKLGASVQLRMDAVQILNLVEGGESTEGFDEEEGYEGEDYTPGSEKAAPAAAATGDAPDAEETSDDGDF